jgi:hypothetical protein
MERVALGAMADDRLVMLDKSNEGEGGCWCVLLRKITLCRFTLKAEPFPVNEKASFTPDTRVLDSCLFALHL